MRVLKRNGTLEKLRFENVRKQTKPSVEGLDLSYEELEVDMKILFTDGIKSTDIQKSLIITALNKIDVDAPKWTFVAARLSLYDIYHDIKRLYGKVGNGDVYDKVTLKDYINFNLNVLSDFHLKYTDAEINELNSIIDSKKDLLFDYLGFVTYRERYAIVNDGNVSELPQHLHMAVAMYLAQNEVDKVHWAKKFYKVECDLEFINATPINSNGRLKDGSTISCLVATTSDSINGIFDTAKEVAKGSSLGSGWGIDWSRVRSLGSKIGERINAAGGKIPFLKIFNSISVGVDQKG